MIMKLTLQKSAILLMTAAMFAACFRVLTNRTDKTIIARHYRRQSWPAESVPFERGAPSNFSASAFFEHLHRFRLRDEDIALVDDERVLHSSPAFVTAFSGNHREEAFDLFDSFRRRFPTSNITVYNLDTAGRLRNLVEKFDFVEVVDFDFDAYSSDVRSLKEYRWKPLIVAEMLAKHDSVWWADTSVRWNFTGEDKLDKLFVDIRARRRFELQLFVYGDHSTFAATHPRMYDFFPTDISTAKQTPMYNAGAILMFATRRVRREILRWWVACALESTCMAPVGAKLGCEFGADRTNTYMGCHRYDQSALNLLLEKAAKRAFGVDSTYAAYTFSESGLRFRRLHKKILGLF